MFQKRPRGIVLFLTLMVLGVTGTAVAFLVGQSGIDQYLRIHDQAIAQSIRAELLGCLEEVLVHFPSTPDYDPASVNTGTATCSTSVQVSGNERTVTLTRTNQGITRRLVAVVTVNTSPIVVTSLLEQ